MLPGPALAATAAGAPGSATPADVEGLSEAVVKGVAGGRAGVGVKPADGAAVVGASAAATGCAAGAGDGAGPTAPGVGSAAAAPTFGAWASGAPRPSLRVPPADLERTVRPGPASGDRWVGPAAAVVGTAARSGAFGVLSEMAGSGVSSGAAPRAVPTADDGRSRSMRPEAALAAMAARWGAGTAVMAWRPLTPDGLATAGLTPVEVATAAAWLGTLGAGREPLAAAEVVASGAELGSGSGVASRRRRGRTVISAERP